MNTCCLFLTGCLQSLKVSDKKICPFGDKIIKIFKIFKIPALNVNFSYNTKVKELGISNTKMAV